MEPEAPVTIWSTYRDPRPLQRPWWSWHPGLWPFIAIALSAIFAARLNLDWQTGKWTPAWADLLMVAAGLAFAAAAVIPDHRWHGRRGDEFVKVLLRRQRPIWWSWSWPIWCLVVFVGYQAQPRVPWSLFELGACLGLGTWYWHWNGIWERMWELYRAEQRTETTHAPGAAPAPSD